MSTIAFERSTEVAHAYHVLAHLDLGRDAASLFDPRLPARSWVEPLRQAYGAARGRLVLHGLPLVHPGPALVTVLREGVPALADAEGQRLAQMFVEALEDVAADPVSFAEPPRDLVEPLTLLRAALWEQRGPAPPLRVFDAPALGAAGRAAAREGDRAVAVNLAAPREHLLCQIFHEEVHAISDAAVDLERGATRDTRAGSPGFSRHQILELAAVEVGQAVIDARLPAWAPAYARWRARVRM